MYRSESIKSIEVFGDNEELTKYDLPKLVYLEAVIKEVLRLYSIVPWVARQIDTDIVFSEIYIKGWKYMCSGVIQSSPSPLLGTRCKGIQTGAMVESRHITY
uniref:SFRICE028456.2 n=1 Tax=Spodoptera frugiperda TaxID=7108 RepID=A0A2H1WP11_SPOFR